jgi:PAS domain S-box-containing protein
MYAVLYIDDDADLLDITRQYLEETGIFRVDTAVSARDALKIMSSTTYDAIIADYQMPAMNGISLLEFTRKTYGNIPFILFTGRGREEVVIEAINNGADYYLQKGGDPDALFAELIHKLQQAIQLRKQQAVLRINEERLRKAQILGQTGAWEYYPGSKMIWASDEALNIFGIVSPSGDYPVEEIEAYIPDRVRVHQALIDLIEQGKEYHIEYSIMPADGTLPRTIVSSAELEKDASGTPLKIVGIIQDVTRQKEMETAILDSEAKYRTLIENSIMGIGIVNKTRVLYANHTLLRIFGYDTFEEFSKIPILDHLMPESRVRFRAPMEHYARGGVFPERLEQDIIRKDGRVRTVEFNVRPLEFNGQKCDQVSLIDITERKDAEAQLRRNEERFREIYQNAPVGIFRSTPEGELIWTNPAFSRMLGYGSAEELTETVSRSNLAEVIWDPPAHRPLFIKKVMESKQWYVSNVYMRHKDGHRLTVLLSYRSLFNPESARTELEGFIEDVTEHAEAEKAIRDNEIQLRLALEATNDGLFDIDLLKTEVYLSPQFYRILGYEPDDFSPTLDAWISRIHPDDAESLARKMRVEILRDRPGFMFEYRMRSRLGEWRWLLCRGKVITWSVDGNPLRLIGTQYDITEQKKTKNALAREERTFRSLVDQLQECVVILGNDGEILFANPAAFRMVMLPEGTSLKPRTYISRFLTPGSFAHAMQYIHTVSEEPNPRIAQLMLMTITGDTRWAEACGIKISYRDREAILVTLHDITEQKSAEEKLSALNRKLHLLSSITRHDIMNKITVILGALSIAKRQNGEHGKSEVLSRLESATIAIRSQVEFTRIYEEVGNQDPCWQHLDHHIRQLPVPPGITLETRIDGIEVYADPMLGKVFDNLLDNTARYGERATRVRVHGDTTKDGFRIVFEDDGVGIPGEDKEVIFERGYGKNTGLGLFLSREILAITGMSIRETGVCGEGVRFEILVPPGGYRLASEKQE